MSDPNEYLRRLCASADLLTEHAKEYEGSGLKPRVDSVVDQILADGLNLSVDSIAGFMMAVGLIGSIDDELCELDPIRKVSRAVGPPRWNPTPSPSPSVRSWPAASLLGWADAHSLHFLPIL